MARSLETQMQNGLGRRYEEGSGSQTNYERASLVELLLARSLETETQKAENERGG